MKKIILALALLILCSCSNQSLTQYDMSSTQIGFDTLISFRAYCKNENEFKQYQKIVSDNMIYYNQLFDIYHNYDGMNNLKTINDNAGKKAIVVDQELIDLLLKAKQYDEISNHQFDITLGSLMKLWHTYREQAINEGKEALPSDQEINEAKANSGWDYLEIDEANSSVYLTKPNVSLDVGGIAKGYAVSKTSEKLKKAGCKHGFINGGGNVSFIGNKPDGSSWSVGLQAPDLSGLSSQSLLSFFVDDSLNFVTSGDYQRYYKVNNQIYHHIIDPQSGKPARYARSVTIICEDGGLADALSTALFTMNQNDGQKVLDKAKQAFNIDIKAIWVYDENDDISDYTMIKDGFKIKLSDGLQEMLKDSK